MTNTSPNRSLWTTLNEPTLSSCRALVIICLDHAPGSKEWTFIDSGALMNRDFDTVSFRKKTQLINNNKNTWKGSKSVMLEGSGRKVDVVLGRFQINWGSAPLQIVTLWSIMVVLWKKRHKICLLSVNERAILRSFHRKRAIFLVVGRHFCMRTCSNTVVDVVWTGEWVHWDRHTLSASWNVCFFPQVS